MPALDLAKHLGAEVIGGRAADVPREAAHAQAVGGVVLVSTVQPARSFVCVHAAEPRPFTALAPTTGKAPAIMENGVATNEWHARCLWLALNKRGSQPPRGDWEPLSALRKLASRA